MVSIQTIANFGWELLSCTAIDAIKVCEHTAERHPIPLLSLLTTADLLKLWSATVSALSTQIVYTDRELHLGKSA